jgi:ketosteroid isomerase-like protein
MIPQPTPAQILSAGPLQRIVDGVRYVVFPRPGGAMDADAVQAIADRWTTYVDAWLSGDAEEVLSYWTPDMRLMEPGSDLGKSDYEIGVREFLGSGGRLLTFDVESYETFVHGEVAYQLGQVVMSIQFAGQEPMEVANRYFSRWEKQADGMWKISRVLSGPRDTPGEC